MRKSVIIIALTALICSGCSWLGWGDDSSTTAAAAPDNASANTAEPITKAPEAAKTPAPAFTGTKAEAKIKSELDAAGRKLAAQSSRTILPNINNPQIKKSGNQVIVSYIAVDPNNVTTQLQKSGNNIYIGRISYAEHFMECRGATKEAAMKSCTETRSKNLTELIRYNGREWEF